MKTNKTTRELLLERLRDLCAVASPFQFHTPKASDPVHEQLSLALKAAYKAIAEAKG